MKSLSSIFNSNELMKLCINKIDSNNSLEWILSLIKNFCSVPAFSYKVKCCKSEKEIKDFFVSKILCISEKNENFHNLKKEEIEVIFDNNYENKIAEIILSSFEPKKRMPIKNRNIVEKIIPVGTEIWRKNRDFIYDKKGKLENTPSNLRAIFLHHPKLKNLYRLNEMTGKVEHNGELFNSLPYLNKFRKEFIEDDVGYLWAFIDEEMNGVDFKLQHIQNMVKFIAKDNYYHPIKCFIESVPWDGIDRLDRWSVNYLGSPDEIFYKEATKLHLMAAIARIYEPGVKYDHILILKGKQGIGKSYVLNILGQEWFKAFSFDEYRRISSEDRSSLISKSWIVNFDELSSKMLNETFKKIITEQSEEFRPKWHKQSTIYKRSCVFFSTTDKERFLMDGQASERRFFVIPCSKIDIEGVKRDQQQVWAQAKILWENGNKMLILPDYLKEYQIESNKNFTELNSFEEFIISELPELIEMVSKEGISMGLSESCFQLKTLVNLFLEKFPKETKYQDFESLMKRFPVILTKYFHGSSFMKKIKGNVYRLWKIL